jgi:SAM-dependent methyltransferase
MSQPAAHAPMSFPDLFSAAAAQYAVARPTYPDALFDWVASESPSSCRAWDCATGSGQAAAGLARHFTTVCASDASREQIARAVRHPRVNYSVQLAERPAYATASFDVVSAACALHWFDVDRYFTEVGRVLRPGGLFAAWTYHRCVVDDAIDEALQRVLHEPIRSYWLPQNEISWNGYRDVAMPFAPVSSPPFHIDCRWTLDQFVAFVRTWSGARRFAAARGDAIFDEVRRVLAPLWGRETRRVILPIDVRAGRRSGR